MWGCTYQVLLGMIWVWPESGPVAFIESAAAEPAVNQRVRDIDPGVGGFLCQCTESCCLKNLNAVLHAFSACRCIQSKKLYCATLLKLRMPHHVRVM